jgi:hypothetical protein
VVGAVDERHAHVDHRVAGLDAGLERLLDPLLDGGMNSDGIEPPLILLTKSKPSPGPARGRSRVAVLAAAAGLAHEAPSIF